jgi:hypothetical protein
MTIPLDNLYHYINGLFTEPVCMYLFYPHGSRNILDTITLDQKNQNEVAQVTTPIVLCHDQEPLNVDYYQNIDQQDWHTLLDIKYSPATHLLNPQTLDYHSNLKIAVPMSVFDTAILLHSEKNSKDLEWYENNGWVGVHYWSHAVIAKDWYRFAKHDSRLNNKGVVPDKNFLIYCRDCTGSRQYRLKFQELLSLHQLTHSSITSINKNNICSAEDFTNKNLVPDNFDFVSTLANNNYQPTESANYCVDDFLNTKISVVLETMFDNQKIHLTEKILRPIACGHPFILAAGPGSLQYLRDYGFKTFEPYIDESYDLETDSVRRLEKITAAMKKFNQQCSQSDYQELLRIADHNRKWFFSADFDQLIHNELVNNIKQALTVVKQSQCRSYVSLPAFIKKQLVPDYHNRKIVIDQVKQLRKLNRS